MPQITEGRFQEDAYPHASVATIVENLLLDNVGVTVDSTPPTVSVISPAVGTPGGFSADYNVAKSTPIVIRATDADPGLDVVMIVARFLTQNVVEVVYRDGGFRGNYIAGSSRANVSNGYDLSCARDEGWPGSGVEGDVVFDVDAIDGDGNRTTTTFQWRLPSSVAAVAVAEVEADEDAFDHLTHAIARLTSQFVTQ